MLGKIYNSFYIVSGVVLPDVIIIIVSAYGQRNRIRPTVYVLF